MADLVTTLQELRDLGVGFVSLTEALDLTTPSGRAMAGLLAVFAEFEREILRERVRAGLAHAEKTENGWDDRRQHRSTQRKCDSCSARESVRLRLHAKLQIGRTSVRRILKERNCRHG